MPSLSVSVSWSAGALGQSRGVDDAMLLKPLADNWPTYSGDYSGKRYSALTQINRSNVKNLTLAWSTRIQPGMPAAGGRGGFGGFGGGAPRCRRSSAAKARVN